MARSLVILIAVVMAAAFLLVAAAVTGAWWLHRQARYDDEIRWLETLQPILAWDRAMESQLDKLYRDRVRRQLDADRVDRAVHALRLARGRWRARGLAPDRELVALGIETFARAADRLEAHGRLGEAADWDDSLFVFAIRAREAHHRYAALAAFQEGLDLRVREGRPCAALARVEWAKRGLGGTVPGLQRSVEEDLAIQCAQARRRGRR